MSDRRRGLRAIERASNAMEQLVGRLSPGQYRVFSALIVASGVLALYCGPVQGITYLIVPPSGRSEVLADLQAEHQSLLDTLSALDTRLERYRRAPAQVVAHPEDAAVDSPGDIVVPIDRAAHESSVTVGQLMALGGGQTSRASGAQRRYQLHVQGSYRAITEFIARLSAERLPIKVLEVSIKTDGWGYPQRPLEAQVTLQEAQRATFYGSAQGAHGSAEH